MQRDFPTELVADLHVTPRTVYANDENISIQTQGSIFCKWKYEWALDAQESSGFFGIKTEGIKMKTYDLEAEKKY